MKKAILFFIMLFVLCINLLAQKEPVFCKGNGYRGYIFDTSYSVLKSIDGQRGRANLTSDEIGVAENILKSELEKINQGNVNQSSGCPNISKKLGKYWRQYFGFINTKGEKVLWVNMFWNKGLNNDAKHDLIVVSDGCSYYWNIQINLTTKKVSNLHVNGRG